MKTWIIVGMSLLLAYLLIMLVCTFKAKTKVLEAFRCRSCLKINKELSKVCVHCGNLMQTGYLYRSTFFGSRQCKNENGCLDFDMIKHHIKIDLAIWYTLIGITAIALILVIILI